MLGQLGTPPANAACTLHRKKHLIIMISREAAEGHIFVAFAANMIKIYFCISPKYKNNFIKLVIFLVAFHLANFAETTACTK